MVRDVQNRSGPKRLAALLAVLATATSLFLAAPQLAGGAPKPPPNPSDSQINAARNAKQALATRVGALSGQIAQANIELQTLQGKAELAEQKYALAYSLWQIAQQKARLATHALANARKDVVKANARFVDYVQGSFMGGSVAGTTGTLLTADDPSAVLEQTALQQYEQQHQADAVGAYQGASVAVSNADARARLAFQAAKKAKANADSKRQAAHAAVFAEQAQRAQLQTTMANTQTALDDARLQLATLDSQRTAYLAYQAEQRRLARIRHERYLRHLRWLQEQQQRQQQQQQSGGSGPPPPSGGNWTAAKGQRAAQRAISQIGWPYAWAGGGAFGPSQGVCDPSNGAPNDCNVTGYDCSGLAMYAWGASWWAHYAATQYSQAGSFHPNAGQLRPGDLIFWSFNGSVSGIHHVAVYIGGGRIVEAPYSGGFVQEASLYEYGGFFGATRPLS